MFNTQDNSGLKISDRFYKISKYDIVLIILIIIISSSYILWTVYSHQSSKMGIALVYQDNILLVKTPLTKERMFEILNGKMQLEIKKGKIKVLSSDCPRKVCVNMNGIQYPGQTIVCMPNKVIIEIKSDVPAFLDAVVS